MQILISNGHRLIERRRDSPVNELTLAGSSRQAQSP